MNKKSHRQNFSRIVNCVLCTIFVCPGLQNGEHLLIIIYTRLIGFNKPAYYGGSGLSPARYFFNASIEKIIELHSQLRNIYLMVSDDWRSAQKIYEDGGFLRIHTFKRYDGFGDVPVHIYKKPLP